MCGIGGIIQTNRRPLNREMQLNALTLLMELQSRGTSAWGLYLEKTGDNNEHLYCGTKSRNILGQLFKRPNSASYFFEKENGLLYLDNTHTILIHTRASTEGDPNDNENNHPFNTKDFILSHNGVIRNNKDIIQDFKIKTHIECDSYVIIYLIQYFYDKTKDVVKAIQEMSKYIQGSYACWLYDKNKKDLYLFRNSCNTPIEYYFVPDSNVFIFASEDDHILRSLNNPELGKHSISTLEMDKIFKLKKEELIEVGELNKPESEMNYMSNRNLICGNQTETESINGSLVELYKLFEPYDKDEYSVETIISLVDKSIILLIKPLELVTLLDSNGFKKYRDPNKVGNSDYFRYIISPLSAINTLVDNLRNNRLNTPDVNYSEEIDDLVMALGDLSDTIGCEFNFRDNYFIFGSKGVPFPSNVLKLFGKYGFSPKKKTNLIKLKATVTHIKKLIKILSELGYYKEKKKEESIVECDDD